MTAALERQILLDTEALAHHLGVSVGTVRCWASRDGWTPHGTRRTRRWDLAQATASYRTRHPNGEDAQHG